MKHIALTLALLFLAAITGSAQSTAFTYQGHLMDAGASANGDYDIQFTLKSALSGGSTIGTPQVVAPVNAVNGIFTVTLDFSASVFGGGDRWVELAVRPFGSAAAYTVLSPRQKITSSPYSVRAASATSVTGTVDAAQLSGTLPSFVIANGSISGAKLMDGTVGTIQLAADAAMDSLNDTGAIGIGINSTNPQATLQLGGIPPPLAERVDGSNNWNALAGAGDVAVSGILAAVTAVSDDAVTFFHFSSPSNPQLRSEVRDGVGGFTALDGPTGVAISGNVAVIAAINEDAVTIVDITNPASPVLRAELRDGVGGFNALNGAIDVAITGTLAVVVGRFDNAVSIIDISNPASPILRAELQDGVGGFNNLLDPFRVAASGNIVMVASLDDHAVSIIDVSTPASPVLVAELRDNIGGFDALNSPTSVAISGNLAAILSSGEDAMTLVDISTPASPVLRATLRTSQGFWSLDNPHSVALSPTTAVVTSRNDFKVAIVDITTPTSPVLKAELRDGQAGYDYLVYAEGVAIANNTAIVAGAYDGAVTLFDITQRVVDLVTQNRAGIGTTAPTSLLEVAGPGTSAGGNAGLDEVVAQFTQTTTGRHSAAAIDALTNQDAILYLSKNNAAYWDLRNTSAAGDQFQIRNHEGTGQNEVLFSISPSGNTGIGTTTPTLAKLVVNGSANNNAGIFGNIQPISLQNAFPVIGFNCYYSGGGGIVNIFTGGGYGGLFGMDPNTGNFFIDTTNTVPGDNAALARTRRLNLLNNGNTGIGRTPTTNKLEVEGDASKATAGSWLANSDRRIKEDILPVKNALDTLNKVRLVDFRYTDDYRTAHPGIADQRYLNVVAQEFAEVFPEHVKSSGEKLPDGSEILQVDTYPLTIYSAAAVQELHRKHDADVKMLRAQAKARDAEIAEMKKQFAARDAALEARLAALERAVPAVAGAGK